MYESPVNLLFQDIERQIVQQQEQTILEAIRKCGVVIDKDELIKAINYDRNQYSKGYKDGVDDVLDKLLAIIAKKREFINNIEEPSYICDGYSLCLEMIEGQIIKLREEPYTEEKPILANDLANNHYMSRFMRVD
jgi:hypothetical protein